jgi:hypothetical protein
MSGKYQTMSVLFEYSLAHIGSDSMEAAILLGDTVLDQAKE